MNSYNILVVEDKHDLREHICKLLSENGYNTLESKDGFDAITCLENSEIDLIISDLRMPNKDGYELLEYVRGQKQYDKLPFIILTAKGQVADLRKGMEMGADDYVIKPVSIDTIILAIECRLSRFKWRSADMGPNGVDIQLLKKVTTLSRTEKMVFVNVASGLTNKEIADKYHLSEMTIKNHRQNIHKKLGLSGSNALLKFCKDNYRFVEIVKGGL
jgi:DNA-binding NarL/FixJ family response regulator